MNMPKFIMLCGICGAGKTTYAKTLDAVHISSDAIRAELRPDDTEYHPEDNEKVFKIMHERVFDALNKGNDVIYDATNVTRKDRAGIMNKLPSYVIKECHIVWAPIEVCIEQDSKRDNPVGEEVINKFLKRFQAPFYDEGFQEIKVIYPNWFSLDESNKYIEKCYNDMCIPHDNPHHSVDVNQHCINAMNFIGKYNDRYLEAAAFWHDVGKPYTKSFTNSKGETTDIAHYYSHQSVGSYISYGFRRETNDAIYVSWLISTHMAPFLNEKYYNNLPAFLKEKIDILHEADLAAH